MNLTHRIRLLRRSGWSRAQVAHALTAMHPKLNPINVRNRMRDLDSKDGRRTVFKLERYR